MKWTENGGLFHTNEGRTIFKTFAELEDSYLAFTHNSPNGEKHDIELFVSRVYF